MPPSPPDRGHRPSAHEYLVAGLHVAMALVVAATFARVGANAPVWDDAPLTVKNPYLASWSGFTTLVSSDIWTASAMGEPSRFYRPFPMLSYLVNARLLGSTPASFHCVNVADHIVNAWLLFALFRSRRLAKGLALPLFVTLAFAIAPVNVEAVAWIAGRFDLLGTTFVLAALLSNGRDGMRMAASTVALVGLALLCKESFVLGAALLVVDDQLVLRRPFRRCLVKYAAFGVVILAFLAARRLVGVMSVGAVAGTGARTLLESFAFLLATYPRTLFDPRILDPFRPYAPLGAVGTVVVLGATLATGVGVARWLRRSQTTAAPLDPRPGAIGLGFSWVVLGFVPVTLTGPNLDMVGDRYAYFPLIGAFVAGCAAASLVFDATEERAPRAHLVALASATLVALGMLLAEGRRTRARLLDWRDERSLFRASLRDDPENAYALYSLGSLEAQEGDYAAAEDHLGRARAQRPHAWRTLDALCYVRLREHRLKSAERLCLESSVENAENPRVWVNLASVYVNGGEWSEGVAAATRAIEAKPSAAEPRFLRAACRANLGDLTGAREDLGDSLRLDPEHAGAKDLLQQLDALQPP